MQMSFGIRQLLRAGRLVDVGDVSKCLCLARKDRAVIRLPLTNSPAALKDALGYA